MSAPTFDITDAEKFELEFVSISELAYIAQKIKSDAEHIAEKMRVFGKSHPEYVEWKRQRHLITRRRAYVLSRIKARQLPLL